MSVVFSSYVCAISLLVEWRFGAACGLASTVRRNCALKFAATIAVAASSTIAVTGFWAQARRIRAQGVLPAPSAKNQGVWLHAFAFLKRLFYICRLGVKGCSALGFRVESLGLTSLSYAHVALELAASSY